jgi:hypothetical protein
MLDLTPWPPPVNLINPRPAPAQAQRQQHVIVERPAHDAKRRPHDGARCGRVYLQLERTVRDDCMGALRESKLADHRKHASPQNAQSKQRQENQCARHPHMGKPLHSEQASLGSRRAYHRA